MYELTAQGQSFWLSLKLLKLINIHVVIPVFQLMLYHIEGEELFMNIQQKKY